MPEAAQTTYRSAPTEIQQKVRRLAEVWRARNVFEAPIQDAIEARMDEIDKSRSTGKKPLMGGSLFGSSGAGNDTLPKELEQLASLQIASSKADLSAVASLNVARTENSRLNESEAELPEAPLYAARLTALLKTLATAESFVEESVRARQSVIAELEKLLAANRASLSTDKSALVEIEERKAKTDSSRREVEDNIRHATQSGETNLAAVDNADMDRGLASGELEGEKPPVQDLAPPPVEALTPVESRASSPAVGEEHTAPSTAKPEEGSRNLDVQYLLASISPAQTTSRQNADPANQAMEPGANADSNLGLDHLLTSKKRKTEHPNFDEMTVPSSYDMVAGGFELDEDVAEMIQQEETERGTTA